LIYRLPAKTCTLLLPFMGLAVAAMLPSQAAEPAPSNVIEALQARLDKGEAKLTFVAFWPRWTCRKNPRS